MALYSAEELAQFEATFGPWQPTANEIAVERRQHQLACRAELARLAALEHAMPTPPRTPEAVCRGYGGREPQSLARQEACSLECFRAPGDERPATRAWLHHTIGRLKDFDGVHVTTEVGHGYSRFLWRGAAACVVARPSGQVARPSGYLVHCVKGIADGTVRDPRGDVGYFASDTWPPELVQFAQIAPIR